MLSIKSPNKKCSSTEWLTKSPHEIALKVNTIDVDLKHPDNIRPAKAPIEGIFTWVFLLLGCCVLLWLLVLGWVILLRQSFVPQPTQKIVRVKTAPPPHQTAMQAIEQLREQDANELESQKAYFIELTEIFAYLLSMNALGLMPKR